MLQAGRVNWKSVALEMALILAAAFGIGTVLNAMRAESHRLAWITGEQRGRDIPGEGTEAAAPSSPADPGSIYTTIPGDVALQLHGSGALFIDARRSSAYADGHIPGALSIPVWEHDADRRVDAMARQGIPFDKVIITYCSGLTCEDSARLAEKLALAGFYRISVYEEGYPDWQKRGWPVTRGASP